MVRARFWHVHGCNGQQQSATGRSSSRGMVVRLSLHISPQNNLLSWHNLSEIPYLENLGLSLDCFSNDLRISIDPTREAASK